MEAVLTDTVVSGLLYLRPPSQNPLSLNSHTNSVFLHSRKPPASFTDTFFASRECPPTRASTVFLISLRILWRTGRNTFKFSRLYNRIRPAKLSNHSALLEVCNYKQVCMRPPFAKIDLLFCHTIFWHHKFPEPWISTQLHWCLLVFVLECYVSAMIHQ